MRVTNYERRGMKPLPLLRIAPRLFNDIYNRYKPIIRFCNDIEVWNNIRHGLWHKYEVYYFNNDNVGVTQRNRLIVNGSRLIGALLTMCDEISGEYETYIKRVINKVVPKKDYEIISDPSNSGYETLSLSPLTVKQQFSKLTKKCITQEQLQELVNKVGSETRVKPFMYRSKILGKIVKWNDCLYQDMHKAHSSFLLRTFKDYPQIVRWVNKNNKLSAKFKCKGDLEKAHYYKDFPNLLVGCLGQTYKEGVNKGQPTKWLMGVDTRPLYNTCVNETYNKIRGYYDSINGDLTSNARLIYAQTDSVIIQHPVWDNVKVSDEVGEFGREEIDNNVIYTYYSRTTSETTGYMIYQYSKHGKKVVVGDLPNELKEYIDLSKGQVITYKTYKDDFGHKTYKDVKLIDIEIEEKN